MMRKVLLVLGGTLLIILVGGGGFVAARQNLRFEAPYPEVAASSDPVIVER